MLGRSSGNHYWLLANASACVSCGFRLRNARNAVATQAIAFEWKPGFRLCIAVSFAINTQLRRTDSTVECGESTCKWLNYSSNFITCCTLGVAGTLRHVVRVERLSRRRHAVSQTYTYAFYCIPYSSLPVYQCLNHPEVVWSRSHLVLFQSYVNYSINQSISHSTMYAGLPNAVLF